MSLLNLLFKVIHFLFSIFKFSDKIIQLLLQQVILLLTIQIINTYSRDLIRIVLNVNLLLGNILIDSFGLLEQIGATLFDCLLLRSVVNDVISDLFSFGMERHN